MSVIPIELQAERIVRRAAYELMCVGADECLFCYVARMLGDVGCDTTLRFAQHYRDERAPRATALERRLGDVGAFCDCEIFLNGWSAQPRFSMPTAQLESDGIVERIDTRSPTQLPACVSVRRGSTQPCSNWARPDRRAQ